MSTIREQIAELERLEREQDREQRAKQSKAWEELANEPSNWEWRCTLSEDKIRCRVEKRIKPDVLAAWKVNGHSTFSSDFQRGDWLGMYYTRTEENILTKEGGGYCVLRDPMLCSDKEWQALCVGDIPAKYIKIWQF